MNFYVRNSWRETDKPDNPCDINLANMWRCSAVSTGLRRVKAEGDLEGLR
jgi:hypothetical protein